MNISKVISLLEDLAPKSMQESYDNSGLIVGNRQTEVKGVLVSLDCTPEIVEEAISKGCNLIVSHHPIVFKGLKKLTGSNYIEQTIISAIKNDIAIYAIHTNLDNYNFGVNRTIGEKMGLKNLKILQPKSDVLCKLSVFVSAENAAQLSTALFAAGAGKIGNYEECQFSTSGEGTFKPVGEANPAEGTFGVRNSVQELKVDYLVSTHRLPAVLKAMKENHPYEEVAHDIVPLLNENQTEGSGMIGELEKEMSEADFLGHLKRMFNCGCIRHTALSGRMVKKIAFCGGSGSFLLNQAKNQGADFFVTGDFKYHEFFDAEGQIVIADIGHYESEQFTVNLLADILKKNFATFAVHLTETNTNPINYF
jgi:dinuclear metal center YbgI/SA1388 family protein